MRLDIGRADWLLRSRHLKSSWTPHAGPLPQAATHEIKAIMQPAEDVAAAIIVRHDRVFVTRRAAGQTMAGLWEFPGGKLEPGETAQACIVRELAEELAVKCEAGDVFTTNLHTYSGGAINLIAVHVHMTSETWHLSVHDDARWVTSDDLLALDLAPADFPIAKAICALLADNKTDVE